MISRSSSTQKSERGTVCAKEGMCGKVRRGWVARWVASRARREKRWKIRCGMDCEFQCVETNTATFLASVSCRKKELGPYFSSPATQPKKRWDRAELGGAGMPGLEKPSIHKVRPQQPCTSSSFGRSSNVGVLHRSPTGPCRCPRRNRKGLARTRYETVRHVVQPLQWPESSKRKHFSYGHVYRLPSLVITGRTFPPHSVPRTKSIR